MSGSRPVVLLHPLGADRSFWNEVVLAAPDVDTLVVDLPGHGAAERLPLGAGIGDFADALADQLARLGHDRVHVAGVSLGGLIAQDLAARRPDLVDRLLLADTVASYPASMRQMWRERAATARSDGLAGLVGPMEQMWFTDGLRAREDLRVARTRRVFLSTDPEGYARACEALAAADTTSQVPAVTGPTLVVCGSEDAEPFREAARWLAEQLPGAQLVWIENARHAAVLEQPGVFAEALGHFLR